MARQPLLVLTLVVSTVLSACSGGCGRDGGLGRSRVDPNAPDPGRVLAPLPPPPQLSLPQEPMGDGGALTVLVSRPHGAVRGDVRPTVTFSRPVKSLADLDTQGTPPVVERPVASLEPAVKGEWRWLGSASVEFVPEQPLPFATAFVVTVPKGLRAIDGATLAEDHVFRFSTPAPQLQEAFPASGWSWVRPDETLQLLFNQPLEDAALAKALRLEVEGEKGPRTVKVVSRVSVVEERQQEAQSRGEPPPPPAALTWLNGQTRYGVRVDKPLPLGRALRLVVSADLRGEQGPLTLGEEKVLHYRTYGPLEVRALEACRSSRTCARGPLYLVTSNEVDLATLKSRLKVTPPVELRWDQVRTSVPNARYPGTGQPTVVLPGAFTPGTAYTVSVEPGLQDAFGQKSSGSFSGQVKTTDLEPSLHTGGEIALIEAGAQGPNLPLEVTNLATVEVSQWKLSLAETATLLARRYDLQAPTRPADRTEQKALELPKNTPRTVPLALEPVLGAKTGLAWVRLRSPQLRQGSEAPHTFVQVTDLAVHLKVGPRSSAVWVNRLSNGEPVAGAEVAIHDEKGNSVWTGTVDAQGLLDLPGTAALPLPPQESEWDAPFLLVSARKDGDVGVTTSYWQEGVQAWEFGLSAGWEGKNPVPQGFLFTDRGIYRPGDTVHVKGVARFLEVGQLKAPAAGSRLTLALADPRGEQVKTVEVTVTRFGTFHADLELPPGVPLGHFSLQATGKTAAGGQLGFHGSLRVEEYRAPQFVVDVAPAKEELLAGEPLEARVEARYLFGGAMKDAQVKWSAHREPESFTAPGFEAFVFQQETWWEDDGMPRYGQSFVASGTATADAKGGAALRVGKAETPGKRTYRYTVEAEVQDVNRQTVAGRGSVLVHPASLYVGLRPPSGFAQVKREVGVDALLVDTKGQRVTGRPLELSVTRRVWKSIQQKDASGGFRTVSEPVEEKVHACKLESGKEPVSCRFTPPEPGFYVLRGSVKDAQGREALAATSLYVSGPGFVSWQREDTSRIELVPDKQRYDVGEVAKILVKSPYPKARAFLTVEREGVLQRRALVLEGSATTLEIPITEEMVPNVFAGVLVMRPRVPGETQSDDAGRPSIGVGLAELKVERRAKRLTVDVKTPKAEYRPGEEVQVSVQVKDAQGKGRAAEVTLYAVDEAVLRLTDYQTPDPLSAIFPDRPLSVRTGEPLVHLVRRRSYGEKGEDAGGGGGRGLSGELRSDFKTTVLFLPTLETQADGAARASFKLPGNLTTFRIMAVAVTAEDRFGSGDARVQVSKPLLAMPALPRFARVGDRFEAGVVVHSRGPATGNVTVRAEVQGGVRLTGPAERTVAVSEGAPREVRFQLQGERPGKATLRFRVSRGDESDGLELPLDVELPVAYETVATYGDTAQKATEGLAVPAKVREGLGGLEVTLASTALGTLQEGFQQLVQYPYGCLEQQSSRLVPFVALRELSGTFGVPWPQAQEARAETREQTAWLRRFLFDALDVSGEGDPDQVIRETVASIQKLQDDGGGFRYWPGDHCPDSYASAYTTLALARAKDVGFQVSPEVIAKAQGHLAKVAAGRCAPCERECPGETRVLASWALARTGRARASNHGALWKEREKLSLFSRALLVDAMFLSGDRARAKEGLQEVLNHAKESPAGVHFEETHARTYATLWHSDTRTTGAVLQTLADVAPDHPYVSKIARYLTGVRRQDGQWRNTQEAAFSLMGLVETVRVKEKETPAFTARVAYGDKPLVEERFEGRDLRVREKKVSLEELRKVGGGKEQPLTFGKEGAGVLYYSARLRYAPVELPAKPHEAGLYVQRWFEPFTGGGQATSFRAGELVRIRVRVASNQERHWVAVDVPLPAGLEPVDTTLATTARQTRGPDQEGPGMGYEPEGEESQFGGSAEGPKKLPWFAYQFWSPFNHVEQRDSRVRLFASHLPPGIHVASFVARATTPGTFALLPAQGELMYEPEVFGRSEGGSFEVVLPSEVSQR